MIATSTQPGMFPVVSANNPLTLVHTLPPPGSTTVSAHSLNTLPSTSGLEVIPVITETTSNGKKVYPCSFCEKSFGSRYNASRHEKGCKMAPPGSGGNQANLDPIICPNCGKHFQTHDGMNRHVKKKCKLATPYSEAATHHRWTGKKVHMCKYCGKQFSTKWNAIRHENLFHTSDEPPLNSLMVVPVHQTSEHQYTPRKPERFCRFCGNYFSTKYNAIRHERICTRISSSAISQNEVPVHQTTTTTETKSSTVTPMIQSHVTTVQIQSPPPQNVATPQIQQQVVLHRQQQQQSQAQQQLSHNQVQQQQQQQNQLTQQIQQLQVQQQLQQQVQLQQQQHEVQQNHPQQQIIVQQAQHHIQQHQQTPQQTIVHQHQQQSQPQQVHITPQQVVFVQPYHVCKFCNKQLESKCDPTPILREDLQNGTINAASLQAAAVQVQTPITPTIITGVSLPMIATLPAHNNTILIQPQTAQRNPNPQQIVSSHQVQQQVQVQIQPQQAPPQQPQQIQQQLPQMQPPATPQQQNAQLAQPPPQTAQLAQPPPRASPVQTVQQKPHGCKFCNKHFATKWYLDQHEKIHTGQAVTCTECNKCFVTRWHLDKHARVHLPGGKKTKRESVQNQVEARYRNPSIISMSESGDTTQQNSINGGREDMVVGVSTFSISDNRTQLQQFGLSPLTQQDQGDK